tara:strand:+ start:560 stop:769 length:210 start_codon:yes stop_codon:yes gene_type:complete
VVYSKDRKVMTLRAFPDVMQWLVEEAERRGISKNEVVNIIIREARDQIYTVHTDEGPKKHVPKRWWQKD